MSKEIEVIIKGGAKNETTVYLILETFLFLSLNAAV